MEIGVDEEAVATLLDSKKWQSCENLTHGSLLSFSPLSTFFFLPFPTNLSPYAHPYVDNEAPCASQQFGSVAGFFTTFFLRSLTDRKWEIEGKNAPNPKFKLLLKKGK